MDVVNDPDTPPVELRIVYLPGEYIPELAFNIIPPANEVAPEIINTWLFKGEKLTFKTPDELWLYETKDTFPVFPEISKLP